MSLGAPEFSRPLEARRVPKDGSIEKIAASPEECRALASRIGVPIIHALSAELRAHPWRGGGIKLDGMLEADLDQVSAVSGTTFRTRVKAPVERFFVPAGIAFDAGEADVDELSDGLVDMGEVVAESLLLAIDPYPRLEGERFGEVELPPVAGEGAAASPFARLKGK